MTDFTIRSLNVESDEEMRQLNELEEACAQESYGAVQTYSVQERRANFAPSDFKKTKHSVAVIQSEGGERVVGLSVCGMPLNENKKTAFIGLVVHPDFRNQGIGSVLADSLLQTAKENGRSSLDSWGEAPVGADTNDPALPWNRIAARLGMEKKNIDFQKNLYLPLAEEKLEKFEAKIAEKIGDYRLETWTEGIPENQLENYGLLLRQLELDEPTGEHQNEAAEFPAERVKENYDRQKAKGFRNIITVAFSPEGEVAGQSEISFKTSEGTTLGWQGNTLVMPNHRGHALGLAMKVANHRKLEEIAPHIRVLVTGNSSLNTQMNAINDQFGYEIAMQDIAYQS
ncbi:GNAT family N-acetyltransferase [uncultured Rothia sp.]|uniref:GNAT family N-acetyltransferase n=1 Tax=uncultured Rothia sp. TaxID=316088 RepID=UPI00321788A2